MTFSWDFNLGHVITLGFASTGLVAGYVTLKLQSANQAEKIAELDKETSAKTSELDRRLDAYGIAIADLRLHVSEQCVKRGDLEKVEDRIGKRLDTVEHTIRNNTQTILATLTGLAPRSRTPSA